MESQAVFPADVTYEVSGLLPLPDYYHPNTGGPYMCRATQLTPAWERLIPGEPVSLDIEFQNFKHASWEKARHRVGRVAIVNSKGDTVLDVYAAYPNEEGVTKFMPPARFLVSHQDFKFENGAVPAGRVEYWVKRILNNRTVIVHGGKHDLTAFVIEKDVFANSNVVDTQKMYYYLQWDHTPGLKRVAEALLGESVQAVVHSPVEDAQTALKLWLLQNTYERDAELEKMQARSQRAGQPGRRRKPTKGGQAKMASSPASQIHENETKPVSTWAQVTAGTPSHVPLINDENEFPPLGMVVKSEKRPM